MCIRDRRRAVLTSRGPIYIKKTPEETGDWTGNEHYLGASNNNNTLILTPEPPKEYDNLLPAWTTSRYAWINKRHPLDDTIIWENNKKELGVRATIILNRCHEHNITISCQKLELGKFIHLAGHIISDKSICPDNKKFEAL